MATYEEITSQALSADGEFVPLPVINNWILMQRKVPAGTLYNFHRIWLNYRNGYGSLADNDNYWLGLEKVYRLVLMGRVRLRVEVTGIRLGGGRDGERFPRAYNGDVGAEPLWGPYAMGRAGGIGLSPLELKVIHLFDALSRAKFGPLSRISR